MSEYLKTQLNQAVLYRRRFYSKNVFFQFFSQNHLKWNVVKMTKNQSFFISEMDSTCNLAILFFKIDHFCPYIVVEMTENQNFKDIARISGPRGVS